MIKPSRKGIPMKKLFIIITISLLASNLIAQDVFETWKELYDLKEIVEPAVLEAEQGNFETTRDLAQDLFEKADFLANSNVPEQYDYGTINDTVNKLRTEAENLFDLIETGQSKDDEIKELVFLLNNTYLHLIKLCEAESDE